VRGDRASEARGSLEGRLGGVVEVEGLGPVGFVGRDDGRVVAVAPWYQVYIMVLALVHHKKWLSMFGDKCNVMLGLEGEAGDGCGNASDNPLDREYEEKCRIDMLLRRECLLNASAYRSLAYASAYTLGIAKILSLLAGDAGVRVRIINRLHLAVEAVAGGGAEEAVRELVKLALLLPLHLFSCQCQEKLVEHVFREVRERDITAYMFSHARQAAEILESVAEKVVARGRAKNTDEYYQDILWRISYSAGYTLIDAMRDLVKLARENASQKGGTGYKIVAEAAREVARTLKSVCGPQPPIPPSEIASVLAVEGGIGLKVDDDSMLAGRLILGALAPFTARLTYRVQPEAVRDEHGNTRITVKAEKEVYCNEGHPDGDPNLDSIVIDDPDLM